MDEDRLHFHLQSRPRRFWPVAIIAMGTAAVVLASACAEEPPFVIATNGADAAPPATFTDPPRDEDAAGGEQPLTNYCPSNKCPVGRTTCPTSRFRCDVDLMTDRNNCGACGARCPSATNSETFECVEGRCVMQCETQRPMFDCDGIPDNGCEIMANTNDHCGACGVKCLDPAKQCVTRDFTGADVGCGCRGADLDCRGWCVDGRNDDYNCGACDNACDPTGDGAVLYANTRYGCSDSECGHLKCVNYWGNCDGDTPNGCETSLLTTSNCGQCGNSCAPGQECRINSQNMQPQCMCPEGKSFCPAWCDGDTCYGQCFDLTTDRYNCGACGSACPGANSFGSNGICRYGKCVQQCIQGQADCNGNPSDGCEVNTDNDPMNCGECGRVCNAVAGQACVGGRCVVEPCGDSADAGGPK
ncbi:hypothetical protein [Labilithrix luteola]|nr:hypothetical protein [Labilithrix luteola]